MDGQWGLKSTLLPHLFESSCLQVSQFLPSGVVSACMYLHFGEPTSCPAGHRNHVAESPSTLPHTPPLQAIILSHAHRVGAYASSAFFDNFPARFNSCFSIFFGFFYGLSSLLSLLVVVWLLGAPFNTFSFLFSVFMPVL